MFPQIYAHPNLHISERHTVVTSLIIEMYAGVKHGYFVKCLEDIRLPLIPNKNSKHLKIGRKQVTHFPWYTKIIVLRISFFLIYLLSIRAWGFYCSVSQKNEIMFLPIISATTSHRQGSWISAKYQPSNLTWRWPSGNIVDYNLNRAGPGNYLYLSYETWLFHVGNDTLQLPEGNCEACKLWRQKSLAFSQGHSQVAPDHPLWRQSAKPID